MESGQPEPAGSLAGIALVNLATITWATNMALGRWLRNDIGPITLAASRFLVASMVYALMLRRRPAEERRLGTDRRLLLLMALSGTAIFVPVLYLGLRYTTAVNATLINGFGPIITGLLAAVLIQEPMTRRQAAGTVLGLGGVLFLISGGSLAFWHTASLNIGDLILLGDIALWSLYSVLARRAMRHRSTLSVSAWSAFLGLPFLLLAAFWEVGTVQVALSLQLVLLVVYIGVVPTVIGIVAWNEGIRRLGSSGAMVFYNTLPLYGALLGFLFLGESIGPAHLIGGALIIAGGLWSARGSTRAADRRS
jgi:drug/metabolite transporter (DMT)-like permease